MQFKCAEDFTRVKVWSNMEIPPYPVLLIHWLPSMLFFFFFLPQKPSALQLRVSPSIRNFTQAEEEQAKSIITMILQTAFFGPSLSSSCSSCKLYPLLFSSRRRRITLSPWRFTRLRTRQFSGGLFFLFYLFAFLESAEKKKKGKKKN